MALRKLPNELVSQFLSYLALDDLLKASSTGKLVHSLSRPFLELARKYRCISLGKDSERCHPHYPEWPEFHTAATFLKEILNQPQIAQYVTHVRNTVDWNDGGSVGGYDDSEDCLAEAKALAEAHEGFKSLLEGSPYYEDHVTSTRDSLLAGQDAAFFGLLLVLLPNVQELCLFDPHPDSDLSALIRKITDVTLRHGVCQGSENHALIQLKIVELGHWDTDGEAELDFALEFVALPSVRTLCGDMVSGSRYPGLRTGSDLVPYAAGVSNIETWDFTYSSIWSAAVEELLPAFKALKTLRYEDAGSGICSEPFEPENCIHALQKYQGHSLESLEMGNGTQEDEMACVGSLRAFQALEVLALDSSLVAKPVGARSSVREGSPSVDANGIPVTQMSLISGGPSSCEIEAGVAIGKLVDFLPASIEQFCLTVNSAIPHMEPMFECFVEQHTETLPNLQRLCLMRGTDANIKLWEKIGLEAGIEVEITKDYRKNTEAMEAGMAAFLEQRLQGEEWRDGDPHYWVISASRQFK